MGDDLEDLARRAAEGSEEARQELLRLYGHHIRRVVRRKLEREQQAFFDSRDFVGELWPLLFASPAGLQGVKKPGTVVDALADTICTQVVEAFGRGAQGPSSPEPRPGQTGRDGPPRILVVEDDEAVRRLLEFALREQGFEATLAAGGRQAVELYRQDPAAFDLVLLDVQMPGWDGPQTLAALRQIDPAVRCCFMSGYAGGYGAQELLGLGAQGVVQKPFASLEELGRGLRQAIGGQ